MLRYHAVHLLEKIALQSKGIGILGLNGHHVQMGVERGKGIALGRQMEVHVMMSQITLGNNVVSNLLYIF